MKNEKWVDEEQGDAPMENSRPRKGAIRHVLEITHGCVDDGSKRQSRSELD